jgi:hypothetical protein
MSLKKTGRSYLRDTQPDVWKIAYDMSSVLAAELANKKWRERAFMFDAFVSDLVMEMMGADGLTELAARPIAELLPENDPSSEDTAQIVASVRAILTAALLDFPDKELQDLATIETAEHALIMLISELPEHHNAGRDWIAMTGVEVILEALKPLAGVTTLLVADRSSGNSIEALASSEKLKHLLTEFWGDQSTVH